MSKYTPMMQHYLKVKADYPEALVFYRLGDFYEMFFEDAKITAYELDLVLTARNAGSKEKVPMCGVPHHAVTSYLQRLVNKGYKIAIVEQLEDPAEAVGLVKRDVVRVITPGTVIEDLADEHNVVYIGALYDFQYGYALALCELASGKLILKKITSDFINLKQTILNYNIKELIVADNFNEKYVNDLKLQTNLTISYENQTDLPKDYLPLTKDINLEYYLIALGRLFNYLKATQKRVLHHLRPIVIEDETIHLGLDYATVSNLELVATLKDGQKRNTLWDYLDKTSTAMGSRLLKEWILKPLAKQDDLLARQVTVEYFVKDHLKRKELRNLLKEVYDIPRILTKISYGNASGIDLLRVLRTLEVVPKILEIFNLAPNQINLLGLKELESLKENLKTALHENPTNNIKDGKLIKVGFNQELDNLRDISNQANQHLLKLEEKERIKTNIKNLKIGYNRVFGYYFEVSKGNLHLIKPEFNFIRKQTLVNAERFVSEELKVFEEKLLSAQDEALSLELALFSDLVMAVSLNLQLLQNLAEVLAEIDNLLNLAEISSQAGFVKPVFNQDKVIKIISGRHILLEKILQDKLVYNDWIFGPLDQVMVLTGPNMGGKTTYMRQNALIVILAQMGSFVPAQLCELPIFDQIFTRMGASDNILSGESTFMVEMLEANLALSQASADSLVLFDEIGRGTATYDGMALAQAMIEYLASKIKAKTIFSTHYHELTELESFVSGVVNYHVEVLEKDDLVTFLYQVKRGVIKKSYGIFVAELAKLPPEVIKRADSIIQVLQKNSEHVTVVNEIIEIKEVPHAYQKVVDIIAQLNINQLTPLSALQLLAELQAELEEDHE